MRGPGRGLRGHHPASRSPGNQPERLAGDGLHPSATAYADWTALALPFAERLLR